MGRYDYTDFGKGNFRENVLDYVITWASHRSLFPHLSNPLYFLFPLLLHLPFTLAHTARTWCVTEF